MKIYFAGSIRGGREDQELYLKIIEHLQSYGTVLTEHIGSKDLGKAGETEKTDEWIFKRDVEWLNEADLVVAEVTSPSLGVGYEIGLAESLEKRIICLFRKQTDRRLSAMISGNKSLHVIEYRTFDDLTTSLDKLIRK
jgi:nucleoside 2-deoxyribosyltransferase